MSPIGNAPVLLESCESFTSAPVIARDVTERKRAEEQIKASLREKEILLKEIQHRVKNNLQVISSLLNLQSGYLKDKQALAVLKESQNRVKSMALIHQILYKAKDLARIDFAEYSRSLVAHLFRSYGVSPRVVKFRENIVDVLLGVDTAIPCGLIVNELVSNSLKYGFPAGRPGEIHIDLRSNGDHRFKLTVSDNGCGLPENLDFRSSPSLGLRLVNKLADQLEGTLEVDRNGGTTFVIEFAELKYEERR